MAIGYVIQQKKITVGATPGIKYVARIFREKQVDQMTVAKEIAKMSSMSIGDVLNVVQSLQEVMSSFLVQGKNVKLDLLGSFKIRMNATAVAAKDEVKPSTITKKSVGFSAGKELKEAIDNAGVEYIDLDIKGLQKRDEE